MPLSKEEALNALNQKVHEILQTLRDQQAAFSFQYASCSTQLDFLKDFNISKIQSNSDKKQCDQNVARWEKLCDELSGCHYFTDKLTDIHNVAHCFLQQNEEFYLHNNSTQLLTFMSLFSNLSDYQPFLDSMLEILNSQQKHIENVYETYNSRLKLVVSSFSEYITGQIDEVKRELSREKQQATKERNKLTKKKEKPYSLSRLNINGLAQYSMFAYSPGIPVFGQSPNVSNVNSSFYPGLSSSAATF